MNMTKIFYFINKFGFLKLFFILGMHFTALVLAFINNLVRSDYYSLDIFKYVLLVKILSHFNAL